MVTSLQGKMGLLFLAFFLLVSISVAATYWTVDTQKQDALIINLAGRQRMLIQQMTKEALQVERSGDQAHAHRVALQEAARTFDQTLWAFIGGGQAPYLSDRTVEVPATHNPDILAGLHQVHQTWDTFRHHLDVVVATEPGSPEFATALQAVERLSPTLVQQADEVVRLYETESSQKVARLRGIQATFFVSALILLVIGFVITQQAAVNPLRILGSAAGRIGQGDLDTPIAVSGPQEVEHLAHSFDTMRAQLKASQEKLVAWAEELETRVAQRTRELTALYEVSREISSRLDIHHVLRSVTDKARQLLDGEVATLCLMEETGQALNVGAVSGPQAALSDTRTSARHPTVAEVLTGEGALPCGSEGCAEGCNILAPPFRTSHLAAPLRVGDQVIGALCVGSSRPGHFSGEAIGLLTKLANSAAIALENARLYQQAERVAMLEERQRIAAEMHDGLAQTLNYLGLKTEQAVEYLRGGQEARAVNELQQIQAAIDRASQEVRQSIANLHQGPQRRQALQDRLAEVVEEFAADGGPPVEMVIEQQPPLLLPPDEAEQVVRVVREAMLNARHHAQASRITLRARWQGPQAAVAVEDDGCGFDPTAPPADGKKHFGLSIMRARAARIGGQIIVTSTPGQGTRVVLTWPLEGLNRSTGSELRPFPKIEEARVP